MALLAGSTLLIVGIGCGIATPSSVVQPTVCPAHACATAPAGASTPAPGVAAPLPGTTVPSPIVTPMATPIAAFANDRAAIGAVVWATAIDPVTNAPTAPVPVFRVTDRDLYATIPVQRVVGGTRFRGTWQYNNTSLDGLAREIVAEHDASDVWIEFHLSRSGDAPWPNGTYEFAVSIDDTPALNSRVDVLDPGG